MSLISMKSQEVLILAIIIWVGSPPFQVKVIILKIENGLLYLIQDQQSVRAGMCCVYWALIECISVSFQLFELNDVAESLPSQGKNNSVYEQTELGLIRERRES